jgi:hypothetical protein
VSDTPAAAKPDPSEKPAPQARSAAAAKAKPPKLEDKPFETFINDDFLTGLRQGLAAHGIVPTSLELVEGERPVVGGRRFWLCFNEAAIQSGKTIALADPGTEPSLIESFLIDEKRITLPLLLSRLLQRLNGQKWLGGN